MKTHRRPEANSPAMRWASCRRPRAQSVGRKTSIPDRKTAVRFLTRQRRQILDKPETLRRLRKLRRRLCRSFASHQNCSARTGRRLQSQINSIASAKLRTNTSTRGPCAKKTHIPDGNANRTNSPAVPIGQIGSPAALSTSSFNAPSKRAIACETSIDASDIPPSGGIR